MARNSWLRNRGQVIPWCYWTKNNIAICLGIFGSTISIGSVLKPISCMRACSILRLETNVDDLPNKIAVAVVRNTGFTQFNVLKAICVIKFSLFQNKKHCSICKRPWRILSGQHKFQTTSNSNFLRLTFLSFQKQDLSKGTSKTPFQKVQTCFETEIFFSTLNVSFFS